MYENLCMRPYQEADLPRIAALEALIQPYRPQDEPALPAMFERAMQAARDDDPRWMPMPHSAPLSFAEEFAAFWVAETDPNGGLWGVAGAHAFTAENILPQTHPLAQEWQVRGTVAELRRVRVAPEARRRGLGIKLCTLVIEWARSEGFSSLVVNTTTPQLPALHLYRKLGFHDVGLSFIDRYELVWLELRL